MRRYGILGLLMAVLCLTGCSQEEARESVDFPDLDSVIEEQEASDETQPEAEAFSAEVYYLTSHQTTDPAELTKFRAHLEQDGFIWNESEILDIPADADMLIYDSPAEDLTTEECKFLEEYMDNGGKCLLLLPASDGEFRYKFLEHMLETFYITMDYDKVNQPEQDADLIPLQIVGLAEYMNTYDDTMLTTPVYMQNIRSFHMLTAGNTDELYSDAMLQTLNTAIGEPYGGTEDDPLTYENENLNIMAYTRDSLRKNATLVVCGASDFLLDENFDSTFSTGAQKWVYSCLFWFDSYNGG